MKRPLPSSAFTLIELLVVVGLIAVLSSLLIFQFAGGSAAVALQSSQATVANLFTGARMQAAATGRKTRVLVIIDPTSAEFFLRMLVWQLARQSGASPADWDTQQTVTLSENCYVLPASLTAIGGLVDEPDEWRSITNSNLSLGSDLFDHQRIALALEGETRARIWAGVAFTPQGTLATISGGIPPKGAIVIATGRQRSPATLSEGESPIRLLNPHNVRGILLSAYGVPTLIDDPQVL